MLFFFSVTDSHCTNASKNVSYGWKDLSLSLSRRHSFFHPHNSRGRMHSCKSPSFPFLILLFSHTFAHSSYSSSLLEDIKQKKSDSYPKTSGFKQTGRSFRGGGASPKSQEFLSSNHQRLRRKCFCFSSPSKASREEEEGSSKLLLLLPCHGYAIISVRTRV